MGARLRCCSCGEWVSPIAANWFAFCPCDDPEDRCAYVYELLTVERGSRTPSLARLALGFPAQSSVPARMTRIRSLRRLLLPLALLGLLGTAAPALACDGGTVQTILFQ